MYTNYLNDRQDLGFRCFKDKEDGKQVTILLKTGVIYITITIFINYSYLFINDKGLTNQSYSNLVENQISSKQVVLVNKLRSGVNKLPENTDQNLEKINESLKESVEFDKLRKNLASKSVKDSKSFTDNSFNKIVIGIINKI